MRLREWMGRPRRSARRKPGEGAPPPAWRIEEAQRARRGVDARALAWELERVLEGEVRFDDGSRALYSTDGSNYRQIPIGVVVPRDKDDVIATVAAAHRCGAPILSRG